jgi:hypothetical protein
MKIVYHLFVAYLTVHLGWYILRERSFLKQAGAALVLVVFLLRLLLIQ